MTGAEIDRTAIDAILDSVGGDVTFLAELMDEFLADSPEQISDMHQAFSAGDAESFRRAAHSLKSNSASFGAIELAEKCKELENIGKSGNLDAAGNILTDVESMYANVKSALEEIRDEGHHHV